MAYARTYKNGGSNMNKSIINKTKKLLKNIPNPVVFTRSKDDDIREHVLGEVLEDQRREYEKND